MLKLFVFLMQKGKKLGFHIIGATIGIGWGSQCFPYEGYLVSGVKLLIGNDIDSQLFCMRGKLSQLMPHDLYNDIKYHSWHPTVFVSGENIYTWYMFLVSDEKLFNITYCETWHPMFLVSGENNQTWYPMFLVSGVTLFIIIYCETWHPMVIRWQ